MSKKELQEINEYVKEAMQTIQTAKQIIKESLSE